MSFLLVIGFDPSERAAGAPFTSCDSNALRIMG
jgi:hypothetical protein